MPQAGLAKTVKIRAPMRRIRCTWRSRRAAHKVRRFVLACAVHGVDADIPRSPTSSPATASSQRRPICSGERSGTAGHDDNEPGAVAAAARKDQDQRARHGGHADAPSHAAGLQRARRGDGLLLRRALRRPRPEAARLCRRISCHGSQMLDYIKELDGVTEPVCIIWGDQDHRAPTEVLEAYRPVPRAMKNVEVHIFPASCMAT